MAESEAGHDQQPPLCVDLDGSLVAGDTLWESLLMLVRARPWGACVAAAGLMSGRAALKRKVADAVVCDPAGLRYCEAVERFVRAAHEGGRRVVLTTAADRRVAEAVASHLGCFDQVIATDTVNAKGEAKLAAIRAELGDAAFDYIGDADCDEPILRAARRGYLVSPSRRLVRRLSDCDTQVLHERGRMEAVTSALRALRPHQWSKNLLLAVPMVVGHELTDGWRWAALAVAVVALSLAASSAYLLNDLLDLHDDRRHATKRGRPIAAGELSIAGALGLAGLLAATALVGAWLLLDATFVGVLGLYVVTTLGYSLGLKRVAMVDVLILAGLYTLRVLAGGIATDVFPSFWLLTFAMFMFLSLAFGKRCDELRTSAAARPGAEPSLRGRGYGRAEAQLVTAFGPTSGYLAVLVFCLYIQSDDVRMLYRQPDLLWLLCPLLLYWVTRFWLRAQRGQLRDDPVLFALKDPPTWVVGVLAAVLLWVAA